MWQRHVVQQWLELPWLHTYHTTAVCSESLDSTTDTHTQCVHVTRGVQVQEWNYTAIEGELEVQTLTLVDNYSLTV